MDSIALRPITSILTITRHQTTPPKLLTIRFRPKQTNPITKIRTRTLVSTNPKPKRRSLPLTLASTNHSSSDESPDSETKHSDGGGGGREIMVRLGEALSLGFPLWVVSACLVALWRPSTFLWVGRDFQILGLTVTMLGMGMTLKLDDLRAAILMPKELAAGFVLQYTVMPLSGFFVSKLLKLPSYYAAGLILVGCCPGGTSSNLVTYIARGNVALSVLMTAISTLTAAIMTAFLTSKLAGQFVAVDPVGLCISTVQVVLAPVLIGAALKQYCNDLVEVVSPLMPLIAVTSISVLGGSAIAQNASAILTSGFQVMVAAFSLHISGFFFGYWFARMLGVDVSASRTISIEVGMQNATLGLVLANQHFANPLTAVPCAVSSICQLICGSALAGIWRCMPPTKDEKGSG